MRLYYDYDLDAIHLVSRYRHEFLRSGDYREALRASLQDVGRALFITSVALVLRFLVFLHSADNGEAIVPSTKTPKG